MLTLIDGPNGADLGAIDHALTTLRSLDGKGTIHRTTAGSLDGKDMMLGLLACVAELSSFRAIHIRRWWMHFTLRDEALGNQISILPSWTRILDRLALAHQAVVVLCMPPAEVCRHRWLLTKALQREAVTAQDMVKLDLIHLKYQEWERAARNARTILPTVVYDETAQTDAELAQLVEATRAPKNAGPGIGMWRAGVTLIVGERPNVGPQERYLGPFCSIKNTGCSGWLNEQLHDANVSEARLYWINAFDRKNDATSPEFVARLQPKRIIALGDVAKRWCSSHGLEHEHVPHPQHWKRFHHHERYPILDLIS